jgi:hypothetical protein
VGLKTTRRVALHMKDNTTIEGLLVKRTRSSFVLIKAVIVQDVDRTHELGGHVEVPRENVYVLQEIS